MRLLSVLCIAVAATLGVSVASARECELTSTMKTLKKVEQNPAVKECGAASGFSLSPPPGKPTPAQLDQICAASACQAAILSLSTLNMPSCTISMLNGINLREIVNEISAHCQTRGASATVASDAGAGVMKITQSAPSSSASKPAAGATLPASTKGKASLRKNCHI